MFDPAYVDAFAGLSALLLLACIIQRVALIRARRTSSAERIRNEKLEKGLSEVREEAAKTVGSLSAANREMTSRIAEMRREISTLSAHLVSRPTRIQHDFSQRLQAVCDRLDDSVGNEKVRAALRRELLDIMAKVELHVACDITEFVKHRSTDKGLTADNVSVWTVIQHVLDVEKYHNVQLDLSTDVRLQGHWIHWELLFSNLIANAVEHASRVNGRVYIQARILGALAAIDITNEGNHIKSEHIDQVFDSGFTTKKKAEGKGLGLHTAQKIAHGLDAQILRPENLKIRKHLRPWKTDAVRFTVADVKFYGDAE